MPSNFKFYLVFNEGRLALLKQDDQYCFLEDQHIVNLNKIQLYSIAYLDKIEYLALEIQETELLSPAVEWLPLKQACHLLEENFFPIISKAAQIILWDKQHQFCGCCGSKTIRQQNTWEKHCTACKAIFYPRISPSIIVLIKKDDKVLMARGPHFPTGVYGLIAGFVEPGENLEESVHREVFEEVGIKIKNLQYYTSQSWPFPNVLMVGFIAEHNSGDIKIDNVEIEAAGWYTKDNLPGRPSSSFSISNSMLEDFLHSS